MRAVLPDYTAVAPATLPEALELLAQSPEWCPLAGGTDLMVQLAAGNLRRRKLLSLWALDELRGIVATAEAITLGALTTYREIRADPLLSGELPMLGLAASRSGAAAIQNRGTIGGNIMNASPAADTPPALLAYDAEVELVSVRGSRRVPYDGFHTGYKALDRRPDEILARIHLPRPAAAAHRVHYYRKVGTRAAQAISKVVMAATAAVVDGRAQHVRIALGSVAPTVVRAYTTEAVLTGQAISTARIRDARAALAQEIAPIDDVRSTRAYRREVAGNLLAAFAQQLAAGGAAPA